MAYRSRQRSRRGFGDGSVPAGVPAGMTDCGNGVAVSQGTPCPVINLNDPAVIKGQSDYNARAARCAQFVNKQHLAFAGLGVGALMLPGYWKFAGLAGVGFLFLQASFGGIWRSPDCDYGF
jgi:hypothetical protein